MTPSDFPVNPLDESHLGAINQALSNIVAARKQIDLATRAGIDVSAQKAAVDDIERKLLQIKQVYFPGR